MRLGLAVILALTGACASLDRPALKTYADVRAAIAMRTDPVSGAMTASSEPAALVVTEFDHTRIGGMDESGLSSGAGGSTRSTQTVFVEGHKAANGATTIEIVRVRGVQVARTAIDDAPPKRSGKDVEGKVGADWRTVYWQPTAYAHECPSDRPYCDRRIVDRLALSEEDVRALLRENADEIVVAFTYWKSSDWRLDADELAAVVDALGARDRFR